MFGIACRDCPLRERCTASATGRTLKLHQHDALMRAHRQRAKDPAWQADYRQHRPMVERSIAWFIDRGRHRRLRYHGQAAGDQWLHLRMATVNLTRLLTLGLTRTPTSTWTLTPAG